MCSCRSRLARFSSSTSTTRDSARLFDQVLSLVSDRFVDTVPSADLYEKAARGLVREINDPYAALYSPKQLAEFTRQHGRPLCRARACWWKTSRASTVVSRVYPHTPAEAGGVHDGDHIVAVEKQPVHGWKLPQVTDALKGNPGTQVSVTFARPGVTAPIDAQAHARGHPHPGRAVHDPARREDRLPPAAAVQRDVGR